ncbi:MAG: ADP-ribosylglycohydrolase family protein [Clostridia bacterium]
MIKLNTAAVKDKIYACWVGKNIGGTMGAPYEGRRELMDIKGFSTPKGTVLPNDDLDLQLAWLLAMEENGPYNLNALILGEYWINYITPHWNEYGIGKCNMKAGLLPPLSGEYKNKWKHSNGAWIRSEIWACMAPGCPDIAIRYALEDACIDHGMGEGTYAEFFTAALESAAFVVDDLRTLISIGLSKIPEDCRVARSVKIVVDNYDKGIDWITTRNQLVEDSADLGWFQAPANVGFVVIGLLYGEGDFKKSMLYAINCGDDTDCTGATLGSILGIAFGKCWHPGGLERVYRRSDCDDFA